MDSRRRTLRLATSMAVFAAAAAVASTVTGNGRVVGVQAFAFVPSSIHQSRSSTCASVSNTQLGLFDGIKEAFSAPALERSSIDAERETPIDRWMGWSVKSDDDNSNSSTPGSKAPDDFVDAMDEKNYVMVKLKKPMGIVFEENDSDMGGIFVLSMTEGGAAATDGTLQAGDQLVAVNDIKVSGKPFDDALGTIVDAQTPETQLLFFRGADSQFYGPTGASQEWLDEYISKVAPSGSTSKEATPVEK